MSDIFTQCPLCSGNPPKVSPMYQGKDAYLVECAICGTYSISRTATVNMIASHDELLPWLSCHTRQVWEGERRPFEILTTNWRSLAESHRSSTVGQKLEKLMRLAEQRTPAPGVAFTFDHRKDYPLIDSAQPETGQFIRNHAEDLKYLEARDSEHLKLRITFDGWQYIERTGLSSQAPARVFVAMSFKDELNSAYDDGIFPAVEQDCGLSCIRLDRVEHTEKICDRILADIRRSHIVFADFTNNAAGVYFEAGFALALGKHVIWSVREDQIGQVHFDTRQYNHIMWKDPLDLRTRLRDRIQARLQEAANHSLQR